MLANRTGMIILAALVAVGGVGGAVYLHQREAGAPANMVAAQPMPPGSYASTQYPAQQYGSQPYASQPQYQNAPPPGYASQAAAVPDDYQVDGYYATTARPINVQPYEPPPGRPVVYESGPAYYSDRAPVYRERYVYRRGRSKRKSVAIVAGSAAAGAAIGAIAGGGQGAAIGAIAGGGAGFIYDRATHNH